MYPGKVANYVPDAFLSQEYWITKPTKPESVETLWLVGGSIVEGDILIQGEKLTYYSLVETRWSATEQAADPDFIQSFVDITKVWLRQNSESGKEDE